MFATRIYSRFTAMTLGLVLSVAVVGGSTAQELRFPSPQAAYEQAQSALDANAPEMAISALEYAADRGHFFAIYHLARLYSTGQGTLTNHGKAFRLYSRLIRENEDIDPYLDRRVRFVADAIVAVARYWQRGVPSIGIRPNQAVARNKFEYAASYFRDKDAQFELARMYLEGEGGDAQPKTALHWLSTLSRRGHPGAQAYLAELFWIGEILPRRPTVALAMIEIAMKAAPVEDQLWIADIHQRMFCSAGPEDRKQLAGMLLHLRPRYERPSKGVRVLEGNTRQLAIFGRISRLCGDGRIVETLGTMDSEEGDTKEGENDTPGKPVEATRSSEAESVPSGLVVKSDKPGSPDEEIFVASEDETALSESSKKKRALGATMGLGITTQ